MDLKLKYDIFILIIIPLISCIFIALYLAEREQRIKAEQKLQSLEKSLSKAESHESKIIYTAYFSTSMREQYGLTNKKNKNIIKTLSRALKKCKRRLKSFLFLPLRLWKKLKWYFNNDFFKE